MSIMSQVREIAYELLDTEGEFTLDDIRNKLSNNGGAFDPHSTNIRSAIYQLKKRDKNIESVGRGKYSYVNKEERVELKKININEQKPENDEVISYLDDVESELTKVLDNLENFLWFRSNETERQRILARGEKVKQLYNHLAAYMERICL